VIAINPISFDDYQSPLRLAVATAFNYEFTFSPTPLHRQLNLLTFNDQSPLCGLWTL
jgi:hypothetical protein